MSNVSNHFVLRSRGLELDCSPAILGGFRTSVNGPSTDSAPSDSQSEGRALKTQPALENQPALDTPPALNTRRAYVMGVLNVTPDSFSDGGLYIDTDRAVSRALDMIREGAELIDVGGASSRPKGAAYGEGAQLVSLDDELARVLPVVTALSKAAPATWISVDTFRSEVAEACLNAGTHIINDITALRFDARIAEVCAAYNAPLILMHSIGFPGEMPHVVQSHHIMADISAELSIRIEQALASGCSQLVLDPGFGFGKTYKDNLRLISNLKYLTELGWPVLIGVSKKNSVGQSIARDGIIPPPKDRVFASLGVASVGVDAGAAIVRTHDVRPTVEFLESRQATIRTSDVSLSYHTTDSMQPPGATED